MAGGGRGGSEVKSEQRGVVTQDTCRTSVAERPGGRAVSPLRASLPRTSQRPRGNRGVAGAPARRPSSPRPRQPDVSAPARPAPFRVTPSPPRPRPGRPRAGAPAPGPAPVRHRMASARRAAPDVSGRSRAPRYAEWSSGRRRGAELSGWAGLARPAERRRRWSGGEHALLTHWR